MQVVRRHYCLAQVAAFSPIAERDHQECGCVPWLVGEAWGSTDLLVALASAAEPSQSPCSTVKAPSATTSRTTFAPTTANFVAQVSDRYSTRGVTSKPEYRLTTAVFDDESARYGGGRQFQVQKSLD